MLIYKAALIGCSRMGAFIDNEAGVKQGTRSPKSHAAAFEACLRTELVACSDLRVDVMRQVGRRFGVPHEKQYTDYKDLIENERPDIISIATQPEPRAEIVIYAANHGVKAIYAEKPMAASMSDAVEMVDAVERNGVHFVLGTHRRWDSGFDKMLELINGGQLGALQSLTTFDTGPLFNNGSHYLDLLLRLNNDKPVAWVQASLPNPEGILDGDLVLQDPAAHGIIQFENDVTAYAQLTRRRGEHEAVLERGVITALNSGSEFALRCQSAPDSKGRSKLVAADFPVYDPPSATVQIVYDLVHSLDTGKSPRGGVRVAYASTEIIFGFIESHRQGGRRIEFPLENNNLRLERNITPKKPRYQ